MTDKLSHEVAKRYAHKTKRKKPKENCTVYLDPELIKWIETKVREGRFMGISHGIRRCIEIVKGSLEALEATDNV